MKRFALVISALLALGSIVAIAAVAGSADGLFQIKTAEASTKAPGWVQQMRQLERVLVDGYPYFFTEAAFRAEKSSAIVKRHITDLKKYIHDIPVQAGESLLGAEPLIRSSRSRMESLLAEAEKKYEAKDFSVSQKSVQSAVNNCVACHTAQLRGKRSLRINDEMFRIYTPTLQKVTSLIAIRQFEGAQRAIEHAIQGKMKYQDPPEQLDLLVKAHLLVSLRTLQDEERALKMLTKAQSQGKNRVSDATKKQAAQWMADLLQWRQFLGKEASTMPAMKKLEWLNQKIAQAENNDEKAYVYLLIKSSILHSTLVNEMNQESFAMSYEDLGGTYQRLGLPFLKELSSVYFDACAKLTGTEASKRCEKQLAN